MPDTLGEPRGEPLFSRLALIGMGLIGSSIARAARHLNLAGTVVAIDRDEETLARSAELGLADAFFKDAAEGVRDCDFVILCVPVGACGPLAKQIAGSLAHGAIVSDVGSVKGAVVAAMEPHLPAHTHFVPAHPVAGTERSGPDAGFATLFLNRWCILTPAYGVDAGAVEQVRAFWEAMGSRIEIMSAPHHDLVLAITSHVPHLIAYNIVGTAADMERVTELEVIKFSAGGFRDFTRIAASDPTMWRDIFLTNKEAVLEMISRFNEDLAALTRAIRWDDGDALFDLFSRTRTIRRGIISEGQETAEPDFGRRRPEE
ncbi:MAG: prephenate/arogenate dehydrogenase family protein [Salinarimonadaceae bacterium]|nr:MAG: prephenate/arogenate dehydrogenase family protein [Salinarimonadaceae bacterium]